MTPLPIQPLPIQPLQIQPLTPDRLAQAVALDQRSLGGLWTLDGYQRELDSPNSDLLMLHPIADPDLILGLGCVWAILEEAHITIVAIDPAYHSQGLGQAMLYTLLHAAWQRQLEWATLEVRESNRAAIELYRKFGFQSLGQRPRYYQDTGEAALILWRRGLHRPDFIQTLQQWQVMVTERLARSGWELSLHQNLSS